MDLCKRRNFKNRKTKIAKMH